MKTIIGCGNLIRKDDGAGPILIRKLWEMGVPDHIRLADGGTAGMDVIFQIGDAKKLVIVDACSTGANPGTVFKLPGEEVETPPLHDINLHNFRWDHALSMGKWLLKDDFPSEVIVYLVEGEDLSPGFGLTSKVEQSIERLAHKLLQNEKGE